MDSEPLTIPIPKVGGGQEPSLARARGSMAIASLVSRVTGFVRQIMLVGVIGFSAINDSYTVSNNLPNIVYELLLGGVLASVVIPVLVQAQQEDADGGDEFAQRLLTVATVVLAVGTIVAVACAPLLTHLYFSGSSTGGSTDNPALTTAFSYLILPEILFYGIFGLLSGILNARHVFKPAAWAPVLNNVVMFATLTVYTIMPGDISLDPVRMGDKKLLVLGIGTTLGVVLQAVVLIRPLLRIGFRFRWRWGWDSRLSTFGKLSAWLVAYTLVSQVAYVVLTQVATGAETGTMTAYSNSWLLLQVPYGVLGVSLLTAIMPRLSKAAANRDIPAVVDNLSTGSRLSAVMLIPLCALITVLGPQIGVALFSIRRGSSGNAVELGLSLTTSAFGLVFFAIIMLQLRVFYAMNDARTPTIINAIMVALKLVMFYGCEHLLDAHHRVYGLTFVNGFGFLVAAIIGEIWLRNRIGKLDTGRVVRTIVKSAVAAAWGAAAALLLTKGLNAFVPALYLRAWLALILGSVVGLGLTFAVMNVLRVPEIKPVARRLAALAGRR